MGNDSRVDGGVGWLGDKNIGQSETVRTGLRIISTRNIIQVHPLGQSIRLTLEVVLPLPYQIRNRIFKGKRQYDNGPKKNAPQLRVSGVKRDSHCCSRLDLYGTQMDSGNTYMFLSHAHCNPVHLGLSRAVTSVPHSMKLDEDPCDSWFDKERRDFHMSFVRRQMPRSPPAFVWAAEYLKSDST